MFYLEEMRFIGKMKEENRSAGSWLPGDLVKFQRQMEELSGSDAEFKSSQLKFISGCEAAPSFLTVTADLCVP